MTKGNYRESALLAQRELDEEAQKIVQGMDTMWSLTLLVGSTKIAPSADEFVPGFIKMLDQGKAFINAALSAMASKAMPMEIAEFSQRVCKTLCNLLIIICVKRICK